MSYSMTFTSLKEDLKSYLERGFSADNDGFVYAQLPRLINLAERKIARELKLQGFLKAVTTPLVVGTAVYQKPDRWRETVSMHTDTGHLFARSYEYLTSYWPDRTVTDAPKFYSDYDYSHWLISPTPSEVTTLEIVYYEIPKMLDETNQRNWLTAYAPNLLLYAALLEATPFIKNDERIPVWQTAYDRAAQALTGEDQGKVQDRSANRSKV